MPFWLALLIFAVVLYVFKWYYDGLPVGTRSIKMLKGYPLVGFAFDVAKYKGDTIETIRTVLQGGDLGGAYVPGGKVIIATTSPELIAHVFRAKEKEGVYVRASVDGSQPPPPGQQLVFGSSMVTTHALRWAPQRAFASPFFHRVRLANYLPVIEERAMKTKQYVATQCTKGPIDVFKLCAEFTLEVLVDIALGVDLRDYISDPHEFGEKLDEAVRISNMRTKMGHLEHLFPFPKDLLDTVAFINKISYAIIDERMKESDDRLKSRADILSGMIVELRKGENVGVTTRQDIRDLVILFFLAGRDTTAILSTMALHLLSKHTDSQQKVREEIKDVGYDSMFNLEMSKRLVYTKKVLNETLRLYPPIPVDALKSEKQGDTLPGGYYVPPKCVFIVAIYHLHRRPDLWPNPDKFDPERFNSTPKPNTFLPFFVGRRRCLGEELAYLEAKALVGTLVSAFSVTPVEGFEPVVQGSTTLEIKNGMVLNFKPL
eukprot:m.324136 g.324136  ORF g.324136 m.324136 type:complete len:487 (-) comp16540_c10_seq12:38-1498(-)